MCDDPYGLVMNWPVLKRKSGVGAAETGESVALGRTRKREGWDSQRSWNVSNTYCAQRAAWSRGIIGSVIVQCFRHVGTSPNTSVGSSLWKRRLEDGW